MTIRLIDPTEETKARVIANIEAANSKAYRRQVASYHVNNHIIDKMARDPFWIEFVREAEEYKQKHGHYYHDRPGAWLGKLLDNLRYLATGKFYLMH